MANVKLSDAELATRVRARTKRASAKYRERKTESGKTQTLVWLPDPIRAQLDTLATERNASLSTVTADLLSSALSTPQTTLTTTTPQTTPAHNSKEARAQRRAQIVELLGPAVRSGASGKELAALAESHGLLSEDQTPLQPQTIRDFVRQHDRLGGAV